LILLSDLFTIQDVIFAAFLAIFLTWFLGMATRVIKLIVIKPTELGYSSKDVEEAIQKCCYLFPITSIIFNGTTVSRGMNVRVTTRRKTIEGQFVGTNRENLICFITPQFVVAHELEDIQEMEII